MGFRRRGTGVYFAEESGVRKAQFPEEDIDLCEQKTRSHERERCTH
jgi:hypothetical protein